MNAPHTVAAQSSLRVKSGGAGSPPSRPVSNQHGAPWAAQWIEDQIGTLSK